MLLGRKAEAETISGSAAEPSSLALAAARGQRRHAGFRARVRRAMCSSVLRMWRGFQREHLRCRWFLAMPV